MSEISKDLVAASSRTLILSILREKENYGYEIIQKVRILTDGQWNWADGMIYPLLHRLESEALITSRWEQIGIKRKRKYYAITELGLNFLIQARQEWAIVNEAIDKAWGVNPCAA